MAYQPLYPGQQQQYAYDANKPPPYNPHHQAPPGGNYPQPGYQPQPGAYQQQVPPYQQGGGTNVVVVGAQPPVS